MGECGVPRTPGAFRSLGVVLSWYWSPSSRSHKRDDLWACLARTSARQQYLDTNPRGRSLAEAGQELYQTLTRAARVGDRSTCTPTLFLLLSCVHAWWDSTRKVATLRSLGDLRVNPSLASVLLP
jgi:hypothetical protein